MSEKKCDRMFRYKIINKRGKENISAVKNSTIGSEYSKVSVKKNEKDSN